MTPGDNRHLAQAGERFIDTVRRVAKEAGLSERTARRYLKRGEFPDADRRTGGDGKTYPAHPRRPVYLSPLHRPLAMARSNIRRAARADTFADGDLDVLRDVVREGGRLLARWETVTRADNPKLSHKGDA